MLYDPRARSLLQQLRIVEKAIDAAVAARRAHAADGGRHTPAIVDKLDQLNRRRDVILAELEGFRIGKPDAGQSTPGLNLPD